MRPLLRVMLIIVLCLAFGTLVGVSAVAPRWGIGPTYPIVFFWLLAIAGGTVGLLAPLLLSRHSWKRMLLLTFVGAGFGFGVSVLVGRVMQFESFPLMVIFVPAFWGLVLGLWLGWLRETPVFGALLGLLILGALGGLGLKLDHPDPAGLIGLAGGFFAAMCLVQVEKRKRILWAMRIVSFCLFIGTSLTMGLLAPQQWPEMHRYRLRKGWPSPGSSMASYSPHGGYALAQVGDQLYLWDVGYDRPSNSFSREQWISPHFSIRFPTKREAYCGVVDRTGLVGRWDAFRGGFVAGYLDGLPDWRDGEEVGWDRLYTMDLSPGGDRAVFASRLESDHIWLVRFDQPEMTPIPIPKMPSVTDVAWVDEKRILLGCAEDDSLRLAELDQKTVKIQQTFTIPQSPEGRIMVSPNHRFVAVSSRESSIPQILDLSNGKRVSLPSMGEQKFNAMTFSFDSHYLFWADWDGMVRVWDLVMEREVRCYGQHRSHILDFFEMSPHHYISGLAVRPDNRQALSVGNDGLVRIWKLDDLP